MSHADPPKAPGYLYYWLLLALFLEYARPTIFFDFINFPMIYSIVPLGLFVVSLFAAGLRPMKDIVADGSAKWVFIFLGLLAVSTALAPVRFSAVLIFEKVLGYVILFLLISRIVTSVARLRGVFITLLAAHLFLLAMNPEVITDPSGRHYISGGTFLGDGNDFALSACILLPLTIELAQGGRRSWEKALYWMGVALIVLAIIGTQSRGATLGVAAVLSVYWLLSPRKIAAALAAGVLGLALLAYAPPVYFQRMGTISTYQQDGSAQGRITAWKGSLGMTFHNPVFGIGAGQFGYRWGKNTHSSYFMPLAELGFPGFLCIVMMVFGNLRANVKLWRKVLARLDPTSDAEVTASARMLAATGAAMLGFGVAGIFLSAAYYPHLYVLSGMLIVTRILVAKERNVLAKAVRRGTPEKMRRRRVARQRGAVGR